MLAGSISMGAMAHMEPVSHDCARKTLHSRAKLEIWNQPYPSVLNVPVAVHAPLASQVAAGEVQPQTRRNFTPDF